MPIESVILDLDETLIHGVFHKDGSIALKIRPYCEDFLEYLFENFNVGIWTHANISWCDTVLTHILTTKQKEEVCFVYTSENGCPRTEGDIKCLDKIYSKKSYKHYFNTQNTLIIEDTFYNVIENKHNAIIIPKYKGGNNDECLLKLMNHFIKYRARTSYKFPKNIKW